ncbi:MAG TPA: hypothetical protein VLJ41_04680 [Segetibacter sp.]|nr:hypothetical protein [Segetibacter sp.]
MKKLLIVLLISGLGLAVNAQPKINRAFRGGGLSEGVRGGGSYKGKVEYVRPRVTVVAPVAPVYPYYSYGLGYRYSPLYSPFYSPFNDPFYGQRYRDERPSQLDLQIEDIKNEYKYKIDNVKDDKSLSKDERKQKVRDLKHEREDQIIDAKKSYYEARDERNDRS